MQIFTNWENSDSSFMFILLPGFIFGVHVLLYFHMLRRLGGKISMNIKKEKKVYLIIIPNNVFESHFL